MSDMIQDQLSRRGGTRVDLISPNDKVEVEIYNSFSALEPIKREWDRFIEEIGGEIFLTYDWCRIWWKYYGVDRDLGIFVFRHCGEICGIYRFSMKSYELDRYR